MRRRDAPRRDAPRREEAYRVVCRCRHNDKILGRAPLPAVQQAALSQYVRTLPLAQNWAPHVSSAYGPRRVPAGLDRPDAGKPKWHHGVDLPMRVGTPLYAILPGRIKRTNLSKDSKWYKTTGYYVVLSSGPFEILYAHMSEVAVRPGQVVTAGQYIGRSGASGEVTGPHLHLQVNYGPDYTIDPAIFFPTMGS